MKDIYLDTLTLVKLKHLKQNNQDSYKIMSPVISANETVDSLITYFTRNGLNELPVYQHTFPAEEGAPAVTAICLKLLDGTFTELNAIPIINTQAEQFPTAMPAPIDF